MYYVLRSTRHLAVQHNQYVLQVRDEMDTRNIAVEFVAEPAGVTPSPAGSRLRDVAGATPPSFNDFTFTHSSVLDGATYRVSFADVSCL
jgi:hypothetical protein